MSRINFKICPKCNEPIPSREDAGKYPGAISRIDNKTEICSECGVLESIDDFLKYYERISSNEN